MAPPPLTSKHHTGVTEYELKEQRKDVRREKARLRMAKIRAELKERSPQEQALAAARARAYQATYRERHREDLRLWEAQRRIEVYKKRFGPEAYVAYAKAKRDRKRARREKRRAKAERAAAKEKRPPSTKHKPRRQADGAVDGSAAR